MPLAKKLPKILRASIANRNTIELRKVYPLRFPWEVPTEFYCGHFLDDKKRVIPDGAKCCFWHWIGLPQRYGKRHPVYPWQETALDDLKQYDYHYLRKPPKVGATQLYLLWGMHQACINKLWVNGQVAIVVGTRSQEAEKMIERCKELISYKDKEGKPVRDEMGELLTKIDITQEYNTRKEFSMNTVEFRAHPAENIDSIRSQPNMRMILIDEIAFFKMVEQQKVRDAFEHYIGGSEVKIILVTTAGFNAGGVGYEIETEHPSIYRKRLYDYNIGLVVHPESMTSLYIKANIDKIRGTPSFNRNFLGVWGYGAGNIYDSRTLDEATSNNYSLGDVSTLPNCLAIDPAYGKVRDKLSSKFAGLGMFKQNGHLWTRSWFELEEPSDEAALKRIRQELKRYSYRTLVCDGHWTGIINTFQSEANAYGINYSEHGIDMTDTASQEVADLHVHIHPTHEELAVQLRSIRRNDRGMPDKKQSRFDLGDCFQQGIWHFTGGQAVGRIMKGKF